MALKEVFLSRVKDRLYGRLKQGKLSDWDTGDLLNFASAIIKDNKKNIDEFLSLKIVKLDNLNESIDELIDKVLIPSIRIE